MSSNHHQTPLKVPTNQCSRTICINNGTAKRFFFLLFVSNSARQRAPRTKTQKTHMPSRARPPIVPFPFPLPRSDDETLAGSREPNGQETRRNCGTEIWPTRNKSNRDSFSVSFPPSPSHSARPPPGMTAKKEKKKRNQTPPLRDHRVSRPPPREPYFRYPSAFPKQTQIITRIQRKNKRATPKAG